MEQMNWVKCVDSSGVVELGTCYHLEDTQREAYTVCELGPVLGWVDWKYGREPDNQCKKCIAVLVARELIPVTKSKWKSWKDR